MTRWVRVLVILGAALATIHEAQAHVVIHVDKSSQRMTVSVDGERRYSFVVSTARAGYSTPNGVYHPERLERTWFSKKYYNSPMPHSIFFHGGYAIHGSYEISRLGGPASHGCIRLHPSDAAALYALVQRQGTGATTIVVSGSTPSGRTVARESRSPWQASRPAQEDGDYVGGPYRRAESYASPYSQPYQPYQPSYFGERRSFEPYAAPRPPRSSSHRGARPSFFGADDDY
jgi:L,D-transpeptidase catalytic domain